MKSTTEGHCNFGCNCQKNIITDFDFEFRKQQYLMARIKSPVAAKVLETEPTPSDEIKFYRANEKPYGVFSNLYKRQVSYEDIEYPTAEHAYQAGKARKEAVRDWILNAPTPALAAMAAHGLYVWDVAPNWAQVKFDRMRGVLRAKFSQHSDLRELLLSTGNARLVEVGTVDNAVNRLWGEVNGRGQNMLGVLLMELREELAADLRTTKIALKKSANRTKLNRTVEST